VPGQRSSAGAGDAVVVAPDGNELGYVMGQELWWG
jgi:hypothetical protein